MEIGHSRLLKLVIPNNLPNMSNQQEMRVEYVSHPTNVVSVVPEEQTLRKPDDANNNQSEDATTDNDDSTFVPVYKVTKEEAAFTKGDLKLQKVAVTENISEPENKVLNPMYSEVQSEVISIPQPLRPAPKVETALNKDEDQESKKSMSRIPKLRQAAEKFKQQRKEDRTKEWQPRRSSIPKLKRSKTPSNTNVETSDTNKIMKINGQEKIKAEPATHNDDNNNNPAEEEFDKMFDEMIHNNNEEQILDTNVLTVDHIEDAEKLEYSFEEIVHDYEENKIQPINVEEIKSKIPLVMQRSLPEEQFVQKLERKSSIKDIPTDDDKTGNTKRQTKVSKLKEIRSKSRISNRKENDDEMTIAKPKESPPSEEEKVHETINVIEKVESVKESVDETPKSMVDNNFNTIKSDTTRNSFLSEKCDTKNATDTQIQVETPSIKYTKTEELKEHDEKRGRERKVKHSITLIPTMQGKVSQLTNKFASNEQGLATQNKKESSNEIPKQKSIVSKISLFGKDSVTTDNKVNYTSEPDFRNNVPLSTSHHSTSMVTHNINEAFIQNNNEQERNTDESKYVFTRENILDDVHKDSEKEGNTETPLTMEIRRGSIENLKFERSEYLGTETPYSTLKINVNSVTPPNTPQICEYETYKDSAHLTGEPKIINIDNKHEINKTGETQILENDCESKILPESSDFNFRSENFYSNKQGDDNQIKSFKKVSKVKLSARDVYNQFEYDKSPSIDHESENPDDLDRVPFFKPVYNNINQEEKNNGFTENESSITGNISKIINRIDSFDERTVDPPKKEAIAETIAVKKSVSSRIAMFERQSSTPLEDIPKWKSQKDTKPKIIEEVLKAERPRKLQPGNHISTYSDIGKLESEVILAPSTQKIVNNNRNSIVHEDAVHVATVVDVRQATVGKIQETIVVREDDNTKLELAQIESIKESSQKLKAVETKVEQSFTTERNNPSTYYVNSTTEFIKGKDSLPKHDKEMLISKIHERLKSANSVNEQRDLKKSKSVAELDLGAAIKGKVHQLIFRMNSVEKINLEKVNNNNINIKERPRKKSVSEKIALFEKTLASVAMETNTKAPEMIRIKKNYDNRTITPNSVEPKLAAETKTNPTDEPKYTLDEDANKEDYQKRIEDLTNASVKYGRMADMMYVDLKNGQNMPVLSLGTAMDSLQIDKNLIHHVIGAALDMGYRSIDTAFIYGNEKQVGDAIRAKIEDGTVKREDLFIVGKLWSTFHRRDLVEVACRASLEALGLEYFDLYLIHNPMSFKEGDSALPKIANVLQYSEIDYIDAWYGMENVYKKGLAKGIGLSNFNSEQIAKVVAKGKIKPVVNQVECHPYLNQLRLEQFCSDHGIKLMCFGALGSKGTPAAFKAHSEAVIDDPLVKVMAAGLNITPAQLLIRYQIECGRAVIAKCSSAAHLWDNLQALTVRVNSAEVDALHALNRNKRYFTFTGMGDTHRNYPFRIPF